MSALTKDRNTLARKGLLRSFKLKATAKIYAGAIVAIGADAFAVPMTTSTDLVGVGRAEVRVDNSSGSDGDLAIEVDAGIHLYANSAAGDEVTASDIGNDCYGVDDQTVAKTDGTGTRSVAGKIFDVDTQGVWVNFS